MEINGKIEEIKNWTVISSGMTGFSATILTLVLILNYSWCSSPCYLLSAAIVLFINATSVNSKILRHFKQMEEGTLLEKWVLFAEWSFGLGFTMLISSLSIITYKRVGIIAPFILMGSTWATMVVYKFINVGYEKKYGKIDKHKEIWKGWYYKRHIWVLIEAIVLTLISLDYLELI